MNNLRLTILENANHSIERSLIHAKEATIDNREWKFGILLIIQAIELVFKEALYREYPALIFENIDNRKNTVSISLAMKRLEDIVEIQFSQSDISAINTAIHWRNQLMHYECDINLYNARKIYYKLIIFLKEFYKERFNKELSSFINQDLWNEIFEIEDFLSQTMTIVKERLINKDIETKWVWECKKCKQIAFVVQDDENICYVCGYVDEVGCCDSCGEVDYLDNMHEIYNGNGRGLDHWRLMCSACHEYIQNMRRIGI